jgi:hypothetical protein
MKHLFSKSTDMPDGSVVIPADLTARWKRQMETNYSELPENEKESDLRQADRILLTKEIFNAH